MQTIGPRRLGLFAFSVAVASGWAGCDSGPARWQGPTSSSSGDVDLDLGTVEAGSKVSGTLQVANKTTQVWRIDRVESSCPCLKVVSTSSSVDAGRSTSIGVAFDPTTEPEFRGPLLVEVQGKATDGGVVFKAQVAVTVEN